MPCLVSARGDRMQSLCTRVRCFLTAEEVPRWFGLSIVLIYLVGLGSVAHYGIVQARRESAIDLQRSNRYAVRLLAEQLSALPGSEVSDPHWIDACQRALRSFAANAPARWLRVVDRQRRVVASTDPNQIDTVVGDDVPRGVEQAMWEVMPVRVPGQRTPDTLVRARIAYKGSTAPGSTHEHPPQDKPALFLEARLPPGPSAVSSVADQARILAIVLVVLGSLFVVYRCLREQLRGVSRIADHLQSTRDQWEEDLHSEMAPAQAPAEEPAGPEAQ